MASSTSFLVSFSLILLSGICGIAFSNQKDVVKTIRTKHGVYDCVDFYKQPAFSHPLLKNHKLPNLEELQKQESNEGIELEGGGCPLKTVPILRTHPNATGFQLYRYNSNSSNWPHRYIPSQSCVALTHTNSRDERYFRGASGAPTIYRPRVFPNQWSTGRIKMLTQNDNIEAGWMVNPSLFKDNEAHLYASHYNIPRSEGCINLLCPGFVQVAKDIPLGMTPQNYSTLRGTQYAWHLSIDHHKEDVSMHNWWLSITASKKVIGYWQSSLFSMPDYFSQVEWGGEISNPKQGTPPEMGNGKKASYNPFLSASVMLASYVDNDFKTVLDPEDTHKVWQCEEEYTVLDGGWKSEHFGRIIYFGGYDEL